MKRLLLLPAFFVAFGAAACGDSESESGPFELVLSPEFIQGALPGERTTFLVALADEVENGGNVELDVSATGAEVTIEPGAISGEELAEVTLIAEPVTDDTEITVTVTGRRGDVERTAARTVIAMPGENQLEPTAREILALFLPWLAENEPGLGLGPTTEFDGMLVGPRLLVVSHYAFFTDEYEVGLAWHIMVAPDDWADLYIRPRDELAPTAAWRLSSWSTALDGGDVTIEPSDVPAEILR